MRTSPITIIPCFSLLFHICLDIQIDHDFHAHHHSPFSHGHVPGHAKIFAVYCGCGLIAELYCWDIISSKPHFTFKTKSLGLNTTHFLIISRLIHHLVLVRLGSAVGPTRFGSRFSWTSIFGKGLIGEWTGQCHISSLEPWTWGRQLRRSFRRHVITKYRMRQGAEKQQ